jgi:NAD(P)-dependent dehydrogenase (short-subunit alcohol dehydrogenase family)
MADVSGVAPQERERGQEAPTMTEEAAGGARRGAGGLTDVAVVCGARGVLGRAVVDAFTARGDRVVAVGRDRGDAVSGGAAVRHEALDLARPDEVERLWDRLVADGMRPRWLVNAAGGFRPGTVAETEPDALGFVQELNLATAWWSCRAAARRMESGDAIVNVASKSAVAGGSGSAGYSVAKAAVVRLTEVLALELASSRVRVNAVLPSVIDTPANRASMRPQLMERAVSPGEVAAVIAFLCSDAASGVTGASLPVYGWV